MRNYFAFIACLSLLTIGINSFAAEIFSDELDVDQYDCAITLKKDAKAPSASYARMVLESGGASSVLVTISGKVAYVASVKNGSKTLAGQTNLAIKPGVPYTITIMRRGAVLALAESSGIVFRKEVPHGAGKEGSINVDKGWSFVDAAVQRLEPVAFSDDFMRSKDEPGNWRPVTGKWRLQSAWDASPQGNTRKFDNASMAQNPFAWGGRAQDDIPAFCVTGETFWEDYTFTTSIRPANLGAVGLGVNLSDDKTGLLVRWAPVNDHRARGNRLVVQKITEGKLGPVLAEDRGGYLPGQWYTMSVTSNLGGLTVVIDGRERIKMPSVTPWRGYVGLYVEGEDTATFDDVTVYGAALKKDLIAEYQMAKINERFANDPNGMKEWASTSSDWAFATGSAKYRVNAYGFFGDHWMVLSVKPAVGNSGSIWMTLNGSGLNDNSGYRAVIELAGVPAQLTYTIFRNDNKLVSKTTAPLTPNTEYRLRFRHVGNQLTLDVDGNIVAQATDNDPLKTLRPAYRAEGVFSLAKDVMMLGRNLLDYTFTTSPTDWLTEGTWMPTVRWSCAPGWSFLSGWSRGRLALWHKQRFTGDQHFQAFVGVKMEYPREWELYQTHYKNLGITICGDGHDPLSGYSAVFGEADSNGDKHRVVLRRNGVIVKTAQKQMMDNGSGNHRHWFDLELKKTGNVIEFWLISKPNEPRTLILSYTDPDPIEGGVPCIWSYDNGISVARARIHFANPPQPRKDTQIVIDNPWYPEWANLNRPFVLPFEGSWATNGKPVTLKVEKHDAPDNLSMPAIDNLDVTFTPRSTGKYWYSIWGTDGEAKSPQFHLNVSVFDSSLGRDDSRALALYRFEEGTGNIIHDLSKVSPALDLKIPATSGVQWVPGQGVHMQGSVPIMSTGVANKLLSIKEKKACTIEMWISTDSIYPPASGEYNWCGCIFAWELGTDRRNFAIGHHAENFMFSPTGGIIRQDNSVSYQVRTMHTGLMHYVITWDGTTMRAYANGKLSSERAFSPRPDSWIADAPLLLGNQSDSQTSYMGYYYLLAIHDVCMKADQVQRHYNAGPSARSSQ